MERVATAAYSPQPVVHYTPPTWVGQPTGGDIAAALLHPATNDFHVMALSTGLVWSHLATTDLVHWKYYGAAEPRGKFGSGGLIYDHQRKVTVAYADSPTVASITRSPELLNFEAPTRLYSTIDPLNDGRNGTIAMPCWDPIMWWDERSARFYAANACATPYRLATRHTNPYA